MRRRAGRGDPRSSGRRTAAGALADDRRATSGRRPHRRVSELGWVAALLRRRPGRMLAVAAGIAVAVALLASIGWFLSGAMRTMTARSISQVAVDWQVETQPGADPDAVLDQVSRTRRRVRRSKRGVRDHQRPRSHHRRRLPDHRPRARSRTARRLRAHVPRLDPSRRGRFRGCPAPATDGGQSACGAGISRSHRTARARRPDRHRRRRRGVAASRLALPASRPTTDRATASTAGQRRRPAARHVA